MRARRDSTTVKRCDMDIIALVERVSMDVTTWGLARCSLIR